MQSVTTNFTSNSKKRIRKPVVKSEIDWALAGTYLDETHYLMSAEIDNYADGPLASVAHAAVDLVLDNNSGRFTPGGTSNIASFIKKGRALRLKFGFLTEYIQNFIGMVVDKPLVDKVENTIKIHALDNSYGVWSSKVKNTAMFTNTTADIIISALLQQAGIAPSLISLDTGAHVIPFAYFEVNDDIGTIITKLCEAEMAHFFVDESGIFRFKTRDAWNKAPYTTSVLNITDDLVIAEAIPDVANVINSVTITGKPRAVQDTQFLYALETAKEIAGGDTTDVLVQFNDPLYAFTAPTVLGEVSYFTAGYSSSHDDLSANSVIELINTQQFSKSIIFTFRNNDPNFLIYLTRLEIWGQPATIIGSKDGFTTSVTDAASIEEFGEEKVSIDNDYIQSADYASSFGQTIIEDRKAESNYLALTIRALPQLQLGDRVTRNGQDYTIVRNKLTFSGDAGFVQELTLVSRTVETYFRIGISTIEGPDLIGP